MTFRLLFSPFLFAFIVFAFLLSTLAAAEEFLDPAVAFQPSVRAVDGQSIEVRFEIAKNYYLYRDKFRFAAEPSTVQLGKAILPPGKEKHDETFGKVEVYYDQAVIRLPVERNSFGAAAADPQGDFAGLCRCRHLLSTAAAATQPATAR
jgi:thiol:disulfide interchange protein DsbD